MEAICIRFLRNSHHLPFVKIRPNIAVNNRVLSKADGGSANARRTFITARPLSRRPSNLINGNNGIERVAEEDFFGFNESTDGVIAVDRLADAEVVDPLTKYGNNVNVRRSEARAEQESIYFMSYGIVRFDGDNVPTVFEEESTVDANLPKNAVDNLNYVDRQYFVDAEEVLNSRRNNSPEFRDGDVTRPKFTSRFDDRPYSDSNTKDNVEVLADSRSSNQLRSSNRPSFEPKVGQQLSQAEDENLIEEQYFGSGNTAGIGNPPLPFSAVAGREEQNLEEAVANSNYKLTGRSEPIVGKFENAEETCRRSRPNADEEIKKTAKNGKRIKPDVQKRPKTAYDYVMKLKAAKANSSTEDVAKSAQFAHESGGPPHVKYKLDSKGFRIYKDQTRDLEKEPEMFVLQLLKNSILYNDHDIVAISKPYGLQCHHGKGRHHRLTKFLPDLAKYVFREEKTGSESPPELYTVHRLDVDTTGVLLLAKTQEMAKKLHDLLVEGKILKTYWALTKGVPSPAEGIVDIPIAEGMVDGRARMVLRPDSTEETRSVIPKYTGKTQKAVTAYRVLATHGKAALVELKPTTGVKHQLRVHLAFALGCPIIGDHKYSHLSKLAPQKLPSDVLQRLHLRQSKARYLPMHLHARGVIVPGLVEGRDLHIGANLPHHFKENLNELDIHFKK